MSHNLQPGDLKLPFEDGAIFPITGLFKDPRRRPEGWHPEERHLGPHEGIDWGCGANTPIYAMAEGTVIEAIDDANDVYGKNVTVRTGEEGAASSFTLTYAHLDTVNEKINE